MTSSGTPFTTAAAAVRALSRREISAAELTVATNEAIAASPGGASSGFATETPSLATAQAARLDAAAVPDLPMRDPSSEIEVPSAAHQFFSDGPFLHGLPVAVKDLFPIEGIQCTQGSERLSYMPKEHSNPVLALLGRGAIIPGTTHTAEMGLTAYTEPIDLAAPENPLYPGCTPGGSSGGAAVSVAQGLVTAGLGSDGGGSIRIPAACCGLVGLKPAHNIHGGRLSTPAFITRTIEDAALLAGVSHTDSGAGRAPRLRIGVTTEPFHAVCGVEKHWRDAAYAAADVLSNAGHDVVEVPSPYEIPGPAVFEIFTQIMTYFSAQLYDADYSDMVQWIRSRGRTVSREQATNCQAWRLGLGDRIQHRWEIDAVITPTLAADPPKIGHFSSMSPKQNFYRQTDWTPWLSLWNLTGWAGVSVPFASPKHPDSLTSVHIGAVGPGVLPPGNAVDGTNVQLRHAQERMVLQLAAELTEYYTGQKTEHY